MTRRDFLIKWLAYALALLPILILALYILPRTPIFGIIPALLPVAAITVAVLEGPIGGAGFGLFVGILADAFIPGTPGVMTFVLCFLSFCAGTAARYGVHQNLAGCLICSGAGMVLINLARFLLLWIRGTAEPTVLLLTGLDEVLWSLVFLPLIYAIFLWVYHRVPKTTVL